MEKRAAVADFLIFEEGDVCMKSVIDLRKKKEKLIENYYKKVRKACSASVAMQFYQLES